MILSRALSSTLGKKIVMAITGVGLFAFVLQHMLGHLIMFGGSDAYNSYAANMQALGALKWGARAILLAAVGLHIWAAVALTRQNASARPQAYQENKNTGASLSSRTMIISGLILAAFIVYHLLQFTIGVTHPADFALVDQAGRHDVYTGMVRAFEQPWLVIFYVVSMALLCVHLSHGVASFFRSLGLMNGRYRQLEERFAMGSAIVVFLCFSSVPVAIIAGIIK
jgi:succinate dehydrogenase / fumarate reductase cytochrome b subunit